MVSDREYNCGHVLSGLRSSEWRIAVVVDFALQLLEKTLEDHCEALGQVAQPRRKGHHRHRSRKHQDGRYDPR